ncbi:hypothetical protein HID58_006536 [Brassica napus]|uniref:Uncharacterized protein n=1 Tax=Brassica napus TaxID=3708 RepID=A0ABQ8EBU3_BRANA|nr:hypothetical protein HID58_006536 [Brassica napus]
MLLGVSSDDETGGCAQCREGSSFHRLGDSPSGIEYSKWFFYYFAPRLIGTLGGLEIFCPNVMDDPASRCGPLLWNGQGVVGDLRFLGLDWSPEWSFTGKMRYLILLLGTPYLAGVFRVPRYLTTCGDDTCRPSPSPSCGMMLLWAEPARAYEFSADHVLHLYSSFALSSWGSCSPDMVLRIWALNRKDSGF